MTPEPAPGTIGAIAAVYASYLAGVASAIADQADRIETLIDAMVSAGAIHCYGFGRSGHAAASLAIRLRHFQEFLPPVWWVGDQVRDPFERGQLLISFSRQGTRFELEELVLHARERALVCAFVTRSRGTDGDAGDLVRHGEIVIELPSLDPALLSPAVPYGGGDFELAAYLFQEALVTRIGLRCGVPASDVDQYHVY
jgi:D-arabinose 5-phosphate isomerase GutQ